MANRGGASPRRIDRQFALAQKIIISVFKIVLPDVATRIEGIAAIAELLASGDQAPRLSKLLEDNAKQLATRLSRFELIEFPGLTSNDRDIAITTVLEAIDKADLTRAEVITDSIVGTDTFKRVENSARAIWASYQLSEIASGYARIYLREAMTFLAALVKQLPDFQDELLAAEYNLTFKVYELLRDGINQVVLPQYREGLPDELSTFESDYRSAVISNNDTTEVFGLNVPEELRRQPIDIAYITLKTASLGDPAAQPDQLQWSHLTVDTPIYPVYRVDEAIGDVIKGKLGTVSNLQVSGSQSRGPRILITGSAGSGKTTIAQWLAIRAARRNFPEVLEGLNVCTPFIVPLRDVFPGESRRQPNLRDLIHPPFLRPNVPGGWLEPRLKGSPLIILDGLDELSRSQKVLFGKWIRQLDENFPKANIIITSRPEGLDSQWLSDLGFVQLALQQMTLTDIRRCISAWFRALATISIRSRDEHRRTQMRLITDVERQDTLRELASTPLLCAMLCAFYAYRHTAAPETRADLYREVVKTLVYEREHDRNAERDDLRILPEKQRMLLLQGLARYMTDASITTIECNKPLSDANARRWPSAKSETAESIIQTRVRRMGLLVVTADKALDILLRRSIVFRRVTYNEAHFAHRSIQEYLASCDYVNDGDISQLIRRLDDPQFWGIIVFAAGQLSTKDVSDLVAAILRYAERHADAPRRSLVMLAAECYVAAGGLQEHVASEVENMIRNILPPVNDEEADMVSRCGSQIVPLLKRKPGYSEEVSAACVRAAAAIGGTDALQLIGDYVDENCSSQLIDEVINGWQRFNADSYAAMIVSRLNLSDHWVNLRTPQIVRAAGLLGSMRKARLETYESVYDFGTWVSLKQLEELDFAENWRLSSLRTLDGLHGLRKINLSGARDLRSIEELGHIEQLRELYLVGCRNLIDISALRNLAQLNVLILDGCRSIRDFRPLSALSQLMTLSINGCVLSDLSFCEGLPRLRRLRALTRDGVQNARALAACEDLHTLEIKAKAGTANVLDLSGTGLKRFAVMGGIKVQDLISLSYHSGLREVRLSEVDGLRDLSVLNPLSQIESASIVDCGDLQDASGLSNSPGLVEVDLSGSRITDMAFVRDMSQLERVVLNRCSQLRDIRHLLSLPSLDYVSCLSVPEIVYPSLERLGAPGPGGKQVAVVYEPLVDYQQSTSQINDDYSPEWEDFGEFYGDQG